MVQLLFDKLHCIYVSSPCRSPKILKSTLWHLSLKELTLTIFNIDLTHLDLTASKYNLNILKSLMTITVQWFYKEWLKPDMICQVLVIAKPKKFCPETDSWV